MFARDHFRSYLLECLTVGALHLAIFLITRWLNIFDETFTCWINPTLIWTTLLLMVVLQLEVGEPWTPYLKILGVYIADGAVFFAVYYNFYK